MKPDGVTMETTEPNEAAALAEPSSLQENVMEEASSQSNVATEAAPEAADEPLAVDPKVKPKPSGGQIQSPAPKSRMGTTSHHMLNDVKSTAAAPGGKKTTTKSKASAAGAVPKRPVGGAASFTAKNQTKVLDKRPVGPARSTSVHSATVTNGTKAKPLNGTSKRPEAGGGARPRTTATANRMVTPAVTKPGSSSTTTKPGAVSTKATRLATAPPASRMTSNTSRPAAAVSSTTATAKTAASKAATAPPTGRTAAAQPAKTSAAAASMKSDVSRPPSAAAAAAAKKPTAPSASHRAKNHEPSKPTTSTKLNSVPKASTSRSTDAKVPQSKPLQPAKRALTKKPVAAARPPANKPALGQTPPASPASKPVTSSAPNTKSGTKPTLTVQPFRATKKTGITNATIPAAERQSAPSSAPAEPVGLVEPPDVGAVALEQESSLPHITSAEVPTHVSAQHTTAEVTQQKVPQSREEALPLSQRAVKTTVPQTSPCSEQSQHGAPLLTITEKVSSPPVAAAPSSQEPEEDVPLLTDKSPSKATVLPAAASAVTQPADLNEEEDEEEREGSQLVSVSEMSGTTQPTEESRPGSGGAVGGAAWRTGGALFSELDSEEVSGSQQGASELSAPGVLEGTESTDDLGDGSLKGAIDMEGASAGSPDFEKVPDIPGNDFDDNEDEDDSDRVCDMDVGSERTDEPQRPRHDNDVEEEDDDDVEMASEGVTESGLESYGNADEDDFAEDERLDNLNRVAQPPPPPPLLPSAPAAQWDQPNPFADPWAEPLQLKQVLQTAQVAASPLANSETPAQVWQDQGSELFTPEKQDVPHHSLVSSEPQTTQDKSCRGPVERLAPPSAPRTSLAKPPISETSTPEDHRDHESGGSPAAQAVMPSPQPHPVYLGLDTHLEGGEEEEAEPETLPADEVLKSPAAAPSSNPSSSSGTEDEASDMEGEAQLDSFEVLAPPHRCLSTVEEREEAEMEEVEVGAGEEATPPSATSLTSYGFDSITTASNSNAQSTGESCIKSPGIFSLEELPQEAKEPCCPQQPLSQQCDAEQLYIECGRQEMEAAEHIREEVSTSEDALDSSSAVNNLQKPEEIPEDVRPPHYSAVCENTEDSFAGFTALPHPHRCSHSAYPRLYCDVVKPHSAAFTPPKLSCADLPPRSPGQQARSPQLRRLEQHQRQLLELQQRREQQSRPLEEAEQERKSKAEQEERRKKEEAEEEIKRNKEEKQNKEAEERTEERKLKERVQLKQEEELKQRQNLDLQQQQQQRQQIMQWQQELQQAKGQLSPSAGLCTIYEALENSDEEAEDQPAEPNPTTEKDSDQQMCSSCEKVKPNKVKHRDSSSSDSPPLPAGSTESSTTRPQDQHGSSHLPRSPERPPPLDLDWGKKVDIIHQLINQTLILNGDSCSSLLLLPGGAGGTLSPLESSLWPNLVPPLTPPSATVTSVSSFSPEATGSSPQGEWTVVELETHH